MVVIHLFSIICSSSCWFTTDFNLCGIAWQFTFVLFRRNACHITRMAWQLKICTRGSHICTAICQDAQGFWRDAAAPAQKAFANVVDVISRFEPVTVCCNAAQVCRLIHQRFLFFFGIICQRFRIRISSASIFVAFTLEVYLALFLHPWSTRG